MVFMISFRHIFMFNSVAFETDILYWSLSLCFEEYVRQFSIEISPHVIYYNKVCFNLLIRETTYYTILYDIREK